MEPEDRKIVTYAIYKGPSDHPDGYVLREWVSAAGETQPGDAHYVGTLEEARALLPQGVEKVNVTDPNPLIIETYA
jgi:hypothetical protein